MAELDKQLIPGQEKGLWRLLSSARSVTHQLMANTAIDWLTHSQTPEDTEDNRLLQHIETELQRLAKKLSEFTPVPSPHQETEIKEEAASKNTIGSDISGSRQPSDSQPSSEDASNSTVSSDENPSGYSDFLPLRGSLGSPGSTDSQLSQDSSLSLPEFFYTSTGPLRINYSDYAVDQHTARNCIDIELDMERAREQIKSLSGKVIVVINDPGYHIERARVVDSVICANGGSPVYTAVRPNDAPLHMPLSLQSSPELKSLQLQAHKVRDDLHVVEIEPAKAWPIPFWEKCRELESEWLKKADQILYVTFPYYSNEISIQLELSCTLSAYRGHYCPVAKRLQDLNRASLKQNCLIVTVPAAPTCTDESTLRTAFWKGMLPSMKPTFIKLDSPDWENDILRATASGKALNSQCK
ncbi:hypothetical protein E1189_05425 [Sansalvadorimonas verongulae]|nr:hypothetical protein [Sansalvadorimonas verongulae]